MDDAVLLPPNASTMIESMRDIGYSFPAAIADLVDNSISAGARRVRIYFMWNGGSPSVAIVDDGGGMLDPQLREAMRPGSRSPREGRLEDDLGRFGLGLKTASFSQCRCLTVASRQAGGVTRCYRWDLDHVAKTNQWSVQRLSGSEIAQLPFIEQFGEEDSGTVVVWENIDRLIDMTSSRAEDVFNEHFNDAREHLELVFHRFIEPMADEKYKSRLEIKMNGIALKAFNPFFPEATARQMLIHENIQVDGQYVRIQPFILPHHSRVKKADYERYAGRDGYAHNQGFYIYRNRRLIDHGTWFRLVPKKEVSRLARVRVDIPNTLDHLWGIDVRKSRATPPGIIKDSLKRVINRITDNAQRVYSHRGKKEVSRDTAPIWQRAQRHGKIHHVLNHEHPIVMLLRDSLDAAGKKKLDIYLRMVEQNVPVEMIFSDMSANPSSLDYSDTELTESLKTELRGMISVLGESDMTREQIENYINGLKPYSYHPQLVAEIMEKDDE